jgi:hypothetical protein
MNRRSFVAACGAMVAVAFRGFGARRAVKADAGCVLTFRDGTKVRVRDTTPRGPTGEGRDSHDIAIRCR